MPGLRVLLLICGWRKWMCPWRCRDLDFDLGLVCSWRARRGYSSLLHPLRLRMRGMAWSSWRWREVVSVVVLGLSGRSDVLGSVLKPSCLSTMCILSLPPTTKRLCLKEVVLRVTTDVFWRRRTRLVRNFIVLFLLSLALRNDYIVCLETTG